MSMHLSDFVDFVNSVFITYLASYRSQLTKNKLASHRVTFSVALRNFFLVL